METEVSIWFCVHCPSCNSSGMMLSDFPSSESCSTSRTRRYFRGYRPPFHGPLPNALDSQHGGGQDNEGPAIYPTEREATFRGLDAEGGKSGELKKMSGIDQSWLRSAITARVNEDDTVLVQLACNCSNPWPLPMISVTTDKHIAGTQMPMSDRSTSKYNVPSPTASCGAFEPPHARRPRDMQRIRARGYCQVGFLN